MTESNTSRHEKADENLRTIERRIRLLPGGAQIMLADLSSLMLDCIDIAEDQGMLLLGYVSASFAKLYADAERVSALQGGEIPGMATFIQQIRAGECKGVTSDAGHTIVIDASTVDQKPQ